MVLACFNAEVFAFENLMYSIRNALEVFEPQILHQVDLSRVKSVRNVEMLTNADSCHL